MHATPFIASAARFAANAHAGQTRKYTGLAYVTHCARVSDRRLRYCTLRSTKARASHTTPK